jgi:hypothetical protein
MSSPPSEEHHDISIIHPPPQSAPGVSPANWLSVTQNRMARKSIEEEQRPLLFKLPSPGGPTSYKDVEIEMVRDEIEDQKGAIYKFEFLKILKMSGPVIFAYMLQNSLQTGSVLVVGRMV